MWKEVHPGIFVGKLFHADTCKLWLRDIAQQREGAPPPNSMNRYGVVLVGQLLSELSLIVQNEVKPVAWMWFPDLRPLKVRPYAFAVDYSTKTQRSLAAHTDSSDVTLNVCLGTKFTGGDLVFGEGKKRFVLKHKVGQAIIHRGLHLHRAMPLTSGERTNLILWCTQRAPRKGSK